MSSDSNVANLREVENLDPALVEQYLREHPNFLRHRAELLTDLELPHGDAGAVSLVERQVSLLRERNIEMRNRLASLSHTAQHNDRLFDGTRALSLELMDHANIADLATSFTRGVKKQFKVDLCAFKWLPAGADRLGVESATDAECAVVEPMLRRHRALSGVLRAEEMKALFGVDKEGSAAVAPLVSEGTVIGLIAVGSDDPHRYQSDDGTLFLEYLADVIVRLPAVRG